MTKHWIGALMALLFCVAAGCNAYTSDVHGTVTADGEKVDSGNLVFKPLDKGVKPAKGEVAGDGSYAIATAEGGRIAPGEYEVLYTPPTAEEDIDGNVTAASKWNTWTGPAKTVMVKEGPNDITIVLKKVPLPDPNEETAKEEPAKGEAAPEEKPMTDASAAEKAQADQPMAEEPMAEKAEAEKPMTEEPKTEASKAEEPEASEKPALEQPKDGEAVDELPKKEASTAEPAKES